MKTYETILSSQTNVVIRVRANTPLEARLLLNEFIEKDDGTEYLTHELEYNGNGSWQWGPFEEVYHPTDIEYATISKDEKGNFNARYEPVKQN